MADEKGNLSTSTRFSEHYGLHAFQMDSTVCIFLLVRAVAEVLAAPPASRADEAVCITETPLQNDRAMTSRN